MSSLMPVDQKTFLELLLQANVLTFGDFVTKSGRRSPYFFNTGNIHSGELLGKMCDVYAQKIAQEKVAAQATNLFGPAYKGIPLAVMTSERLSRNHQLNFSYTFNRKEAKDHGEGGSLVGYLYKGGEKVVIIEDVLTAGTSIRESLSLLKNFKVKVVAVVVGIDRCETGSGTQSAKQEIESDYQIPVYPVIDLFAILNFIKNKQVKLQVPWPPELEARIEAYLANHCKPAFR